MKAPIVLVLTLLSSSSFAKSRCYDAHGRWRFDEGATYAVGKVKSPTGVGAVEVMTVLGARILVDGKQADPAALLVEESPGGFRRTIQFFVSLGKEHCIEIAVPRVTMERYGLAGKRYTYDFKADARVTTNLMARPDLDASTAGTGEVEDPNKSFYAAIRADVERRERGEPIKRSDFSERPGIIVTGNEGSFYNRQKPSNAAQGHGEGQVPQERGAVSSQVAH